MLGSLCDHVGTTLGSLWVHGGMILGSSFSIHGDEPFVASPETSTFGSPGGGKESVYRLYLVTTV